jgi:small subunit ribosomal protein S2
MAELEKLETNLGGVADMKRLPDAILLVDLRKEQLAVREARRLGIPVIGLVDTNCDPDDVDFVIPGNDDAIRACSLIVRVIADGVSAGGRRVDITELTGGNGQPDGVPGEEPAGEAEAVAAEAAPDEGEQDVPAADEPAETAAAEPDEAQPEAETAAETDTPAVEDVAAPTETEES